VNNSFCGLYNIFFKLFLVIVIVVAVDLLKSASKPLKSMKELLDNFVGKILKTFLLSTLSTYSISCKNLSTFSLQLNPQIIHSFF